MNEDETKQYVIDCMIQRLPEQDALQYLKDKGLEMSRVTYWRKRKKILNNRFKRIQEIADHELIDQHLERIDELKLIKKEMWTKYRNEDGNTKSFYMLVDLANIQPLLSQYYATNHKVIEKQKGVKLTEEEDEEKEDVKKDNNTETW